MSVFSIIKRGRAQAKEHNAKQADKDSAEAVKLPYKHVPTHAATDALATAPSSWKHDDRPKIKEQNRRRSAMAANGARQGGPRVGSSLAYVSYPSVYASPVAPLPKNYSYSSIPSSWRERMASTPEASEEPDYFSHARDHKGKGKEIMPSFAIGTGGTVSPILSSGRASPLSSRAELVTVGVGMAVSKGAGPSSGPEEDEKEMKRHAMKNVSFTPEPRPPPSRDSVVTGERLHRLHPAHSRKASESRAQASSDRHYPPAARSTYFSGPRPTSRRAHSVDNSMPAPPVFPGPVYGHATSSAASSVTSIGMAISTAPTSATSTPPPLAPENGAHPVPQNFQLPNPSVTPAVRHQRRGSFRDYLRTSSDTIRLPSSQPAPSQAPPSRGRRLSKSKPQQPNEVESPVSVHHTSAIPPPPAEPTLAQARSMAQQPIQQTFNIQHSINTAALNPNPTPTEKSWRRRLSKDRPPSRDQSYDAQTSSSSRWSFFRRRNSMTGP